MKQKGAGSRNWRNKESKMREKGRVRAIMREEREVMSSFNVKPTKSQPLLICPLVPWVKRQNSKKIITMKKPDILF